MTTRRIRWEKYENPKPTILHGPAEIEPDDNDITVAPVHFASVMTPIGMIPVGQTHMNKSFNFWIGHTNFTITELLFNVITKIPGVETLEVYTRYRFRVGIGLAFNEEEVKSAIEESLQVSPINRPSTLDDLDMEIRKQVHTIIEVMEEKQQKWAIYVLPNQKIVYSKGDEYNTSFALYSKCKELVGGHLFTSEKEDVESNLFMGAD